MSRFAELPLEAIPSSGLIHHLVSGWRKTTESPNAFLLGSALTAVSLAAGNRYVLDNGSDEMYLNLYQLFVGASTSDRKSTALNLASRVLEKAEIHPYSFPRTTLEGLFAIAGEAEFIPKGQPIWEKQTFGLWIEDEFSSFLAILNKDYNSGFKYEIMRAYDSIRFDLHTKKSGRIRGRFEGLSILSATTPSTFGFIDVDYTSGFLGRWNFFITEGNTDREYAFRQPLGPEFPKLIYPRIKEIREKGGKLKFSDQAIQSYTEWYSSNRKNTDIPQKLVSFYQRNQEHAKKYAALYALGERRLEIKETDLARAYILIEWQRKNLRILLGDSNMTQFQRSSQKILEKLKRSKDTTPYLELLRNHGILAKDLKEILETLVDSGIIFERKVEVEGSKPLISYGMVPTQSSL